MFYAIWIPIIFLIYVVFAYLSEKSSGSEGFGRWFLMLALLNAMPMWPLVSKYSKNLLFDGMLYDIVIASGYVAGIIYFTGSFSKLTWINWTGIVVALCGLLMLRYKI